MPVSHDVQHDVTENQMRMEKNLKWSHREESKERKNGQKKKNSGSKLYAFKMRQQTQKL